MSGRCRVAVLISGRGSNMQALLQATQAPDFPAQTVLVLADRGDAGGLAIAHAAGVSAVAVERSGFADKASFEAVLETFLAQHKVQLICLAGFLRLLSADFVDRWRDRMINIHPSLLPAFRGLDTHARALAAGVKLHGCTVHFVRAAVDDGPIVAQAAVPVFPSDTAETLAARVLDAEHQLYPAALRRVASGLVRVEGERAVLDGVDGEPAAFFWPPLTGGA